jgi:hypothetical protein
MTSISRRSLWPALLILTWSAGVQAHTRSVSYSFWDLAGNGAEARARVSQLELTRAGLHPDDPAYRDKAAALLMRDLRMANVAGTCVAEASLPADVREGRVVHRWRVRCAGPPQRIAARLLMDAGVGHTHFVTLRRPGAPPETRVLTPVESAWDWTAADEAAPDRFAAFLVLGVEHIVTGWDHLAFLLVLLVLAGSLRELVWLATGFTLGHSLTLALAVLGVVRPAAPAVEAFIALSIVLVALENGWRLDPGRRIWLLTAAAGLIALGLLSPTMPLSIPVGLAVALAAYAALLARGDDGGRLRLALTAAFGLFHGFGFAGVLTGMDLPDARIALALLGFNLGVELGQIVLLALAWPLLLILRRLRVPAAPAATGLAAGIGLFWYLQRLFG